MESVKLGSTKKTVERHCPTCNHKFDSATPVGHDRSPEPGDISICIECGELLEYDDNMQSILLTDDTMSLMEQEDKENLAAIRSAIRRRNGFKL